jgi:hypothetical protein
MPVTGIISVIVSATSGAAVSGLMIWLFKEWLSTRLKASIQHEYDRKLETHKAQLKREQELAILDIKTALAREAAFHAAAHGSFVEGQKAAMERKLSAVDKLWGCIPQFRASLPPVLMVMDVMTVEEYKGAKEHPQFKALAGDLTPETMSTLAPKSIEEVRPYVGEYMWAVFFCYQTILIRILVLLQLGRTDAEKIEWYKDGGTRQVIAAVLTPVELAEFDGAEFAKITWLQRRLESKLLGAARKIISGENFGAEALEQAKLIQERIAQLSAEGQLQSRTPHHT